MCVHLSLIVFFFSFFLFFVLFCFVFCFCFLFCFVFLFFVFVFVLFFLFYCVSLVFGDPLNSDFSSLHGNPPRTSLSLVNVVFAVFLS